MRSLRASLGLTTPTRRQKELLWSKLDVPQANIFSEEGGYKPNRIVQQAHHHPARAILLAGGVRGGKSLSAAMEVVPWSFHSRLIWLAAETYDLTRQEFEYTYEAMLSMGLTEKSRVSMPRMRYSPCSMDTMWGCRIETRSLQDIETFASRAPDLVVICEPGQAPSQTLAKARERLSTRRGRLWMAGTFEDVKESWMEDVWRRWVRWPNAESGKSFAVPTWLNTVSFPGGRNDPEMIALQNSYGSQNEFLLRCAGVPVAGSAIVIGEYWQHRKHVVPNLEYRPVYQGAPMPVEITVDPGYSGGSHYVVLAIQHIGSSKLVIDEVAVQSKVHESVIEICKSRPWWKNVVGGTIDPYAGGNHIYGALSPQETWQRLTGFQLRLPPRLSVEDYISNLCAELRDPNSGQSRIAVSPRCQRLIWEMTHWRKRKAQGGDYTKPSDANCDASKALGYYLADRQFTQISRGSNTIKESAFAFS
jgi:hypothetical protein